MELKVLIEKIKSCNACKRSKEYTPISPIPSVLDSASLIIVDGEPNEDDDLMWLPMESRGAQMFLNCVIDAGFHLQEVYRTNIVKCFGKKPTISETSTCRNQWLGREVAICKPKVILALGKLAIESVYGEKCDLKNVVGKTKISEEFKTTLAAWHHPSKFVMGGGKLRDKTIKFLKKLKDVNNV